MLQSPEGPPSMQGTLWKWTNYLTGWQPRWFILDSGVLSYYLSPSEVNQACRGSLKVTSCDIIVHPTDHQRLDIVVPGGRHIYLRAASTAERQQWLIILGFTKQGQGEFSIEPTSSSEKVRGEAVKSKMAELHVNCQLLMTQITSIKSAVATPEPDVKTLTEMSALVSTTCDAFLNALAECMDLSYGGQWASGLKPLSFVAGDNRSSKSSPSFTQSPITPTRMTIAKAGPPIRRSSSNEFSESELYAHTPRKRTTPTTPIDSRLTFSLPTHLPGNRKTSKARKINNSGGDKRVSFEVNQSQTSNGTSVKDPTTNSEEPLPVLDEGRTGMGQDSEVMSHSHDSPDSGHSEVNSNHLPADEISKPLPPKDSRTIALSDDSSTSTKSPSRSSSDLFLTPTSSPNPSPPPTPQTPTSNPTTIHSPTTNPSPPPTPQTPTVKPKKIGDRISIAEKSHQFDTFFSRPPQKFEDLVLLEEDSIPTEDFLGCCKAVVPFFDTLSPTAFSPVKSDINGNIEKLLKKFHENPERYVTLQAMVLHELQTNTHSARNSATDALLWLKRAMEFIQVFIAEVAAGEQNLDVAAGKAYSKSLRRYHNWMVRGIFSLAVRAVPYRKDFLVVLGSDGSVESESAVVQDMSTFSHSLGEIMTILNEFYEKNVPSEN